MKRKKEKVESDGQQPAAEAGDAAGSRGDGLRQDAAATKLWPWLVGLTLPLYVLDQWTKFWAIRTFSEPDPATNWTQDQPIVVIEGFLNWKRVHNQGVAFGMGNGTEWAPLVFPFVSLIAFVLIWKGLKTGFFFGKVGMLAVALLLCGICGNLTDRMIQGHLLSYMEGASWWEKFKAGYVVDFIDVTIPIIDYPWPVFNVADSCICVAAVLLFISGWKADAAAKKKEG